MDENDETLPEWLISAREEMPKIRRHWETVYSEAQEDIRRGLEVSEVARHRLAELDYVERVHNQNLPLTYWSDEIVTVTGTSLTESLCTYTPVIAHTAQLYEDFGHYKQEQHEFFFNSLQQTVIPSCSAVYMTALIEQRFEAQVPNYTVVLNPIEAQTLGSREQTFEELRQHLDLFDLFEDKFLHMLIGSEDALQAEGHDHLSQAAHSMRDLFQQLIEYLAPRRAVEQQPWFEPTPGALGEVSRRSRLRYILYGSGERVAEEEIKLLDEAAENAKIVLDLCIARAHSHDLELTKSEVRLAIDQARFALLQVLKRYRQRQV